MQSPHFKSFRNACNKLSFSIDKSPIKVDEIDSSDSSDDDQDDDGDSKQSKPFRKFMTKSIVGGAVEHDEIKASDLDKPLENLEESKRECQQQR